ncbi:MAG TPA: NAD(+) diphosphatase [Polyangiales bacterium]
MSVPFDFVPSTRFSAPPEHGLWFVFRRRELMLLEARALPTPATLRALGLEPLRTQFLGVLSGTPCFSAEIDLQHPVPDGATFHDLRTLHGLLGESLWVLAGRAVQVMDWDRTHQFCGACGGPTQPHPGARARVCAACRLEVYPRLAPAMIVAVERGEEVLLARGPHFPRGVYSTLAGFVDPGESVEEAVHREVFEETGVRLGALRYFKSQPWPFPHSLMLGFFAEYASGTLLPEPGEIEDAGFFHVDRLPQLFPGRLSIGNQLLADFCARHGRAFPADLPTR